MVLAHPEDQHQAVAITEIANRIYDELLPPVEMAGCTTRIFELAQQNLA